MAITFQTPKQRTIAVCGATGRQGGAVVKRMLDEGWHVRALTRDRNGTGGQALAQLGAEVAQADLFDVTSLEKAMAGAEVLFGVTDFWEHGYEGEIRMGSNLIEAARQSDIGHFIFSSVGGTERIAGRGMSHFETKAEIESRLVASGLDWTILRPVTFYENFITHRYRNAICNRGLFRFAFDMDHKFQMVAMHDLAVFAAKACNDDPRIKGHATEIASDSFTMEEMVQAIGAEIGRPVRYQMLKPPLMHLIGVFVSLTKTQGHFKVGKSLINQFAWNNGTECGGWDADIPRLKTIYPDLMSLQEWVRTVDWREGL